VEFEKYVEIGSKTHMTHIGNVGNTVVISSALLGGGDTDGWR